MVPVAIEGAVPITGVDGKAPIDMPISPPSPVDGLVPVSISDPVPITMEPVLVLEFSK